MPSFSPFLCHSVYLQIWDWDISLHGHSRPRTLHFRCAKISATPMTEKSQYILCIFGYCTYITCTISCISAYLYTCFNHVLENHQPACFWGPGIPRSDSIKALLILSSCLMLPEAVKKAVVVLCLQSPLNFDHKKGTLLLNHICLYSHDYLLLL